jgi:hypothetical protein
VTLKEMGVLVYPVGTTLTVQKKLMTLRPPTFMLVSILLRR